MLGEYVQLRKRKSFYEFVFFCPVCNETHELKYGKWRFSGNIKSPSFSPSLVMTWTRTIDEVVVRKCHLSIKNGIITYHGDCSHECKNKTMPMVKFQ